LNSTFNPHSAPKEEFSPSRSPSSQVLLTCTVRLTNGEQVRRRLLAGELKRWVYLFFAAILGFEFATAAGTVAQILIAVASGALGWFGASFFSGMSRAKSTTDSDAERVLTYHFYDDGFEVVTTGSPARVHWSSIHRFADGPNAFVLYTPQKLAHIIPKRDLRPEDVAVLKAMSSSHVRRLPFAVSRPMVVVLVVLAMLMFLAVWQYLQTQP
jgi:YcxB-like protein